MRDSYFDYLYGNSSSTYNVVKEYNEDGTYELVEDHSLDDMDREIEEYEKKRTPIQTVEHQTQQNIIVN